MFATQTVLAPPPHPQRSQDFRIQQLKQEWELCSPHVVHIRDWFDPLSVLKLRDFAKNIHIFISLCKLEVEKLALSFLFFFEIGIILPMITNSLCPLKQTDTIDTIHSPRPKASPELSNYSLCFAHTWL